LERRVGQLIRARREVGDGRSSGSAGRLAAMSRPPPGARALRPMLAGVTIRLAGPPGWPPPGVGARGRCRKLAGSWSKIPVRKPVDQAAGSSWPSSRTSATGRGATRVHFPAREGTFRSPTPGTFDDPSTTAGQGLARARMTGRAYQVGGLGSRAASATSASHPEISVLAVGAASTQLSVVRTDPRPRRPRDSVGRVAPPEGERCRPPGRWARRTACQRSAPAPRAADPTFRLASSPAESSVSTGDEPHRGMHERDAGPAPIERRASPGPAPRATARA